MKKTYSGKHGSLVVVCGVCKNNAWYEWWQKSDAHGDPTRILCVQCYDAEEC